MYGCGWKMGEGPGGGGVQRFSLVEQQRTRGAGRSKTGGHQSRDCLNLRVVVAANFLK